MGTLRPPAIAFFLLLACLYACAAEAGSLYVAPGGNDAGAGTRRAPFRTITRAAKAARPGDTVFVRAGVYREVVSILSKGTAGAWIAFRPYRNERAVIDGTGSEPKTPLVQLYDAEYVEVRGFEIRNATSGGLHAYGAGHIRLVGNTIHHSQRNGISVSAPRGRVASDILIRGNRVFENCLDNQAHTATSGWGQAIGVFRTEGVRIEGNKVYRNHGEGIDFILSNRGVASGNEVWDNYGTNVYLDNARQITVDRNFIYTTFDATYFRHGAPANGISVANERYETRNPSGGLTITNNIVVGARLGFHYGNYHSKSGLTDVLVANNTFYGARGALVQLDPAPHENTRFVNNIFAQYGGAPLLLANVLEGVAFARNNWSGGSPGQGASPDDVPGDPLMVNPGTYLAESYRLTPRSPLLRRGLALEPVRTDYSGAKRPPGPPDLGAHQLSRRGL